MNVDLASDVAIAVIGRTNLDREMGPERWSLALRIGEFRMRSNVMNATSGTSGESRSPFGKGEPIFGADDPVRFRPLQKPATEDRL